MKLNPSSTNRLLRRGPQALALGALAFAVQIACSDAPQNGVPTLPSAGSSGASSVLPSGGMPGAAGSTVTPTAGTFSTTAGSAGTFSTAGTDAGGTTAAAGTGGTGGAAAGTGGDTTAGTGGTPVVPVAYCMGKTAATLPYSVNPALQPATWGPATGLQQIKVGAQIVPAPADACAAGARVAGAVGDCTTWQFTPDASAAAAFVAWTIHFTPTVDGPKVCVADGAKAIVFYAKGAVGGEVVSFGGGDAADSPVTLTKDWKQYSIPLGTAYNDFTDGVVKGFAWAIAAGATTTTFYVDGIRWVTDIPADPTGGGEGGAGGSN